MSTCAGRTEASSAACGDMHEQATLPDINFHLATTIFKGFTQEHS